VVQLVVSSFSNYAVLTFFSSHLKETWFVNRTRSARLVITLWQLPAAFGRRRHFYSSCGYTTDKLPDVYGRCWLWHTHDAPYLAVHVTPAFSWSRSRTRRRHENRRIQEAQLSLTNRAMLVCKVVEVWKDFLSEYVDKKFSYICYRRLIRHEWIYYDSKNCVDMKIDA